MPRLDKIEKISNYWLIKDMNAPWYVHNFSCYTCTFFTVATLQPPPRLPQAPNRHKPAIWSPSLACYLLPVVPPVSDLPLQISPTCTSLPLLRPMLYQTTFRVKQKAAMVIFSLDLSNMELSLSY